VRVRRDDPPEGGGPQAADVAIGQAFEETLLADAPDVVAGVLLAVVEDAEVQTGLMEEPRGRAGDLLRALVERGVVTDEPQDVDGLLPSVLDREVEVFGPRGSRLLRPAEGVAV